jgi:hypothetical protein
MNTAPTDSHEIPYIPADPQMVERIREALAKRKYEQMMEDAQFSPGVIVDTAA